MISSENQTQSLSHYGSYEELNMEDFKQKRNQNSKNGLNHETEYQHMNGLKQKWSIVNFDR